MREARRHPGCNCGTALSQSTSAYALTDDAVAAAAQLRENGFRTRNV